MKQRTRCSDCAHWVPSQKPKDPKEQWVGECHRYAPRPNFLQIPVPPGAVGFKPPNLMNMTVFPPTGESTFCGEFIQRTVLLEGEQAN